MGTWKGLTNYDLCCYYTCLGNVRLQALGGERRGREGPAQQFFSSGHETELPGLLYRNTDAQARHTAEILVLWISGRPEYEYM